MQVNVRTRYHDEMPYFFWADRALRVRSHNACLFNICEIRMVEKWFIGRFVFLMCKLSGSLVGEFNLIFVVVLVQVRVALGDRRVSVEVV
jgi:hypothetical protein